MGPDSQLAAGEYALAPLWGVCYITPTFPLFHSGLAIPFHLQIFYQANRL